MRYSPLWGCRHIMKGSTVDFFHNCCHLLFQLLAGAAVNEKTHTGETALHLAGVRDHSSIVSILIENNIDVDAVDENLNNSQLPSLLCCFLLLFLKF